MDFRNFFHRFFGNPSPSDFGRDSYPETEDYHRNIRRDDVIDDFENLESPSDMFHHIEDMFNRMFSFPFGMIGFPNVREHLPEENKSPRSIMLKETEEEPSFSSRKDFEDSIVSPINPGKKFFEKSYSFSKFSSIKTVRLPDGTIEEHKTVIDNDGKKTTKVRHIIGDSSHEVITKSDNEGIKEKEENFINMDESELPKFEQKWSGLKSNPVQETETSPSLTLPPSSPTYLYLLKKFFDPSKKVEIESC